MEVPELDIGPLHVQPALVLAPLSGKADSPFRQLVRRASGDAVGLMMGELVSAELLERRIPLSVRRLKFTPSERPIALQLFGADPASMADAAAHVEELGADLVDINCGCPAPKVIRKGGGSALLRDLPQLARVLEAVVARVAIPVTIKIRSGWDEHSITAAEVLRVAQDCGVSALSIHGRTRVQRYRGQADWELVRELSDEASIPVLGSGDIRQPSDVPLRLRGSGCAGVLIGRAAIGNPWIFRQATDLMAGREPYQPSWAERLELLHGYHEAAAALYPSSALHGRLKMLLARWIGGFPGAPELRLECLAMNDPEAMLRRLEKVVG